MTPDRDLAILVVDDDATIRGVARKLLDQLCFCRIAEAADGISALDVLRSTSVGLVISDWNMEPMDGLDLVKEMRKDAAFRSIPVILVTADTRPGNAATVLAAGASVYLVKPYDRQGLAAAMEKALRPS